MLKQIYLLPTSVATFPWDVTDIFVILSKHAFMHILFMIKYLPEPQKNKITKVSLFPHTIIIIIIKYATC